MKALTALTLTVSLISFNQTGLYEKLYKFKDYERYIYDYHEIFQSRESRGRFEIVIKHQGDAFEVSIVGSYRNWRGSISKKFRDAYEISGFILLRMYFDHYWLIPLGRTLFLRGLVKTLSSKKLDWNLGRKKVGKDIVRKVRECKVGGLKGRMMELVRRQEVVFRLCVSPQDSLPIYVYRKTEEGNVYEIKLLEYSDLK